MNDMQKAESATSAVTSDARIFDRDAAGSYVEAAVNRVGLLRSLFEAMAPKAESADATEAIEAYVALKDSMEALEEHTKEINKLINRFKFTILPQLFERQNIETFTTKSGYRVTVTSSLTASIKDREEAFKWLRENGLEDLITETVNAQTLSAAIRHMVKEEGREPPEEIIEVKPTTSTSLTKVRR